MNKTAYFVLLKNIRDNIPATELRDFDLQFAIQQKSTNIALMLSLFFGSFGADRFYAGRVLQGLIKLLTVGGLGVWTIIDWFLIIGVVRSKNIEIANSLRSFGILESSLNKDGNIITILKYTGIFFAALIAIGIIVNFSEGKQKNLVHFANSLSVKGYSLSSKEQRILDMLLYEEAVNFSNNNFRALLAKELLETSAGQIAVAYNENQVAADQRYDNKLLLLSGRIEGINSGLGNEPYLVLYGLNQFQSPQAHFEDGNEKKIASLRKYQPIYLVCKGNGAIVGTPMLKDCQFPIDYIQKRIPEFKIDAQDFLSGNSPKSRVVLYISLATIAITRILPETSVCFANTTDKTKCLKALHIAITIKDNTGSDRLSNKMAEVANELKALGVQVPVEIFSKGK